MLLLVRVVAVSLLALLVLPLVCAASADAESNNDNHIGGGRSTVVDVAVNVCSVFQGAEKRTSLLKFCGSINSNTLHNDDDNNNSDNNEVSKTESFVLSTHVAGSVNTVVVIQTSHSADELAEEGVEEEHAYMPTMYKKELLLNMADFCYRIMRTLHTKYDGNVTLMKRRECERLFASVIHANVDRDDKLEIQVPQSSSHTCACDRPDTYDLMQVLHQMPSSPFLIRSYDRHLTVQENRTEVDEVCSYMLETDSFHDEAINMISFPDTIRFHEDEYNFNVSAHRSSTDNTDNNNNNRELRLLCIVYSMASHHDSHIYHLIVSWGSRCTGFLVFSTSTFDLFPHTVISIPHEGDEEYNNLWRKVVSVWLYVHKYYVNEFDYFYICGDDTYMIVGHMHGLLHQNEVVRSLRAHKQPAFLGRQFRVDVGRQFTNHTFNSGGPGYVLDRIALAKLVETGFKRTPKACSVHKQTSAEDTHIAACLRTLGIFPSETRDPVLRNRFHHTNPHQTYVRRYKPPPQTRTSTSTTTNTLEAEPITATTADPQASVDLDGNSGGAIQYVFDWFVQNSLPPVFVGPDDISDTSIAFHWVDPGQMMGIDYYFMQCLYYPNNLNSKT
jgi:glycoprotein-N-acetylgalactosamine 3-beta-galactosyltransferase